MINIKKEILENICYTELVYERINKKLQTYYQKSEIEKILLMVIKNTDEKFIVRKGKNFYLSNPIEKIRITLIQIPSA